MAQSPEHSYIPASSNETSPLSNEDVIAQKILKRVEIAKMTRQLKEKLFKAGLKVRDQNCTGTTRSKNTLPSSNTTSPSSSPSKSLSEDVTNNITATAISNIQNSKLVTPTRENTSFEKSTLSFSTLTPAISPLKRTSSSIYRQSNSHNALYENEDELQSPVKRMNNGLNSSPYTNYTSPYQYTRGSLVQTPQSLPHSQLQAPKTPPLKQEILFHPSNTGNFLQPFTELNKNIKPTKRRDHKNRNSKENVMLEDKNNYGIQQWNNENNIDGNNENMDENEDGNEDGNDDASLRAAELEKENTQSSLLSTPKSSNRIREFTTPNKNSEDLGADLLLFLSNSPARTFNGREQKDLNKMLVIPTTPKSSSYSNNNGTNSSSANNNNNNNANLLESTPLRNQFHQYLSPSMANSNTPSGVFMQPLLGTPIGISMNSRFANPATPNNRQSNKNLNKTPGFSMSDYINFTPSPRVARTPDFNFSHALYSKPVINYSKELNLITSIKEDEDQ